MPDAEPRQYWIRNDQGTVWGPLTYATIALLVDSGAIPGRLQCSYDGINFAFPGRFAELRDAFPKELWGTESSSAPAATLPAGAEPARPRQGPAGATASSASAPRAPPTGRPPTSPPIGGPPKLAPAGSSPPVATSSPHGPTSVGPSGAAPSPGAPSIAAPASSQGPNEVGPTRAPSSARSAAAIRGTAPAATTPPSPHRPIEVGASGAPAAPSVPPSGDLSKTSAVRLYGGIAAEGLGGRLTLATPSVTYEIFFKKGSPEAARSDATDDDLGAYLERAGAVKAEAIADAAKLAGNYGNDLVAALFALQRVNPNDVFRHLGDHAIGVLRRALATENGEFQFDPQAPFPPTLFPLGNKWGLLCDAIRRLPPADLRRRVGEKADRPVMKSGGRVTLEELKLTPQETKAATYFDGVRSTHALVAAAPSEADAIIRAAFLLSELEIVSFAEARPAPKAASPQGPTSVGPSGAPHPPKAAEPARPQAGTAGAKAAAAPSPSPATPREPAPGPASAAPVPAGPRPAAAATTPSPRPATATKAASPAAKPAAPRPAPVVAPSVSPFVARAVAAGDDPAKLQAIRDEVAKKDHFEALGVPRQATMAEIKNAYFHLAKCFHPDSVQAGAPPDAAPVKGELFARVSEAWQVLCDDKRRKEYLEELEYGSQKVDVARLLAAEETFQKACIVVKARKYEEGLKMIEAAIQLNDQESEFFAWRGYARFLGAKDKAAVKNEAFADIARALKLSDRCAQAHYLAGVMHKVLGDARSAEQAFARCVSLDANHRDAQSELRVSKMRR